MVNHKRQLDWSTPRLVKDTPGFLCRCSHRLRDWRSLIYPVNGCLKSIMPWHFWQWRKVKGGSLGVCSWCFSPARGRFYIPLFLASWTPAHELFFCARPFQRQWTFLKVQDVISPSSLKIFVKCFGHSDTETTQYQHLKPLCANRHNQ